MPSTELVESCQRTQDAARRLEAEAADILEIAKEMERLTNDTSTWYAGMRARVEVRAVLEQAEEVSRALGARGISYRVQSPNTGR